MEMSGVLPFKLNSIIFSGRGVKALNPNVFRGIRSRTLSCVFKNTSMVRLTSEIFRNTGRATNVTIDIRDNRDLQHVQNPSTGGSPNLHKKTFLIDFKIVGNKLSCDCDIGYWFRCIVVA